LAVVMSRPTPYKTSPLTTDVAPFSRGLIWPLLFPGLDVPYTHEERWNRSSRILVSDPSLAPQAELGDEASISLYVFSTEIIEQSPALADHEQQTTTTVVVVLVVTKVFGEMVDPLGEQRHLDLR